MSFFEYMVSRYGNVRSPRGDLARYMKELSEKYPQVMEIDSFYDLISLCCQPHLLRLPDDASIPYEAHRAVSDSLWAEFCADCDHPL